MPAKSLTFAWKVIAKQFFATNISLDQLCPARGPVEGFVRPSLGFSCNESILHTDNQSFIIILDSTLLIQVVLSATLLRLLSLQLGCERFQYN